jgi:hypothetical protein
VALKLQDRLDAKGHSLEWANVIQDLDALQEIELLQDEKRFLLRTETQGSCGKVFQSVGVALPSTVRAAPQNAEDGEEIRARGGEM